MALAKMHNGDQMAADDDDDEEDEESDHGEYQVRRLSQSEDLVIDGETVMDDMLVAQRIAEADALIAEAITDDSTSIENGEVKTKKAGPSRSDVGKLLRLVRQANKLSQKISDLPDMFDGVVGDEVREACRQAAEAIEKLPIPKDSGLAEPVEVTDEAIGEETWEGNADPEAVLAAVDLESTDEEGEEAAAAIKPRPVAEAEEEADAADELDDEADGAQDPNAAVEAEVDAAEPAEPVPWGTVVLPEPPKRFREDGSEMPEDNAPQIKILGLPERLGEDDQTAHIGLVHALVDNLLVVAGHSEDKVLDIQSVVCTEDKEVIGVVIDVFGPVSHPHYLVFPTRPREEPPAIGAVVIAAVGLEETSFLCDSADLNALRDALGQKNKTGALGDADSDDSEEEDDEEDSYEDEEDDVDGSEDAEAAEERKDSRSLRQLARRPGALAAAALRAGAMAASIATTSGGSASSSALAGPPARRERQPRPPALAALPPPPPLAVPPPPPERPQRPHPAAAKRRLWGGALQGGVRGPKARRRNDDYPAPSGGRADWPSPSGGHGDYPAPRRDGHYPAPSPSPQAYPPAVPSHDRRDTPPPPPGRAAERRHEDTRPPPPRQRARRLNPGDAPPPPPRPSSAGPGGLGVGSLPPPPGSGVPPPPRQRRSGVPPPPGPGVPAPAAPRHLPLHRGPAPLHRGSAAEARPSGNFARSRSPHPAAARPRRQVQSMGPSSSSMPPPPPPGNSQFAGQGRPNSQPPPPAPSEWGQPNQGEKGSRRTFNGPGERRPDAARKGGGKGRR